MAPPWYSSNGTPKCRGAVFQAMAIPAFPPHFLLPHSTSRVPPPSRPGIGADVTRKRGPTMPHAARSRSRAPVVFLLLALLALPAFAGEQEGPRLLESADSSALSGRRSPTSSPMWRNSALSLSSIRSAETIRRRIVPRRSRARSRSPGPEGDQPSASKRKNSLNLWSNRLRLAAAGSPGTDSTDQEVLEGGILFKKRTGRSLSVPTP